MHQVLPNKIHEVTEKVWLDTIDTNVKAPLFLSRYLHKELKKKRCYREYYRHTCGATTKRSFDL